MGGDAKRADPGAGRVNTIGVASLDVALQDGAAYWQDTKGSTFGIMRADLSAK